MKNLNRLIADEPAEMTATERLQCALGWGMAHCAAFAVKLGLSQREFGAFAKTAWRQQRQRQKRRDV